MTLPHHLLTRVPVDLHHCENSIYTSTEFTYANIVFIYDNGAHLYEITLQFRYFIF